VSFSRFATRSIRHSFSWNLIALPATESGTVSLDELPRAWSLHGAGTGS